MVTVPATTPVTEPPDTVATDVLSLLHTPPTVMSVSVMDEDSQTDDRPVIVPDTGSGFTVTVAVATAVPQELVTE